MICAARRTAPRSARARGTYQVRDRNSSSGKSQASAWTSCGRLSVTAPVSAGLVRVRIASSSAVRQLLGPVDPVPVLRDGLERVAGRVVPGEVRLQLLQHRAGAAAGEDVAGQAQHRQPVHGGGGCAGDHVGGARADRGGDRHRTEPVLHLGVAGRDVDHALLVAALVEPEVLAVLQQRLADAGHVAVAEDAQCAAEERLHHVVALNLLSGEEADDGLSHGEAERWCLTRVFLPRRRSVTLRSLRPQVSSGSGG